MSGYVIINVGENQVKIPGVDILEFVAFRYVMTNKIAAIEQKTWQELLTPNKTLNQKKVK